MKHASVEMTLFQKSCDRVVDNLLPEIRKEFKCAKFDLKARTLTSNLNKTPKYQIEITFKNEGFEARVYDLINKRYLNDNECFVESSD